MPDLTTLAQDRWEVSPGGSGYSQRSTYLDGQLERIKDVVFSDFDDVLRVLRGGFDDPQQPTMGYRIVDVDLVAGSLFGAGAHRRLWRRSTRAFAYRAPPETASGAIYESWSGNRWFGMWLCEDCLAYRLAEATGHPVATLRPAERSHRSAYEALLGIAPRRFDAAHFDELILFDDLHNNPGKAARARDMRDRLLAGRDIRPVPGVFLLRGRHGDTRVMINEREIADRLASDYGFVILDPMSSSVEEIVAVCGQARVIAGVEGSHLVHGVIVMPQDALLFVIQPPERACVTLKALTDRQGQGFAFVVGEGGLEGFTADWTEIRRTLDLALES